MITDLSIRPGALLFITFLFLVSSSNSQTYNVTFRINMSGETISPAGVHIAGNFQEAAGLGNNWDPSSTLVTDINGDKIYEITVQLPSGTYEYKFINGNAWGMDENPPSDCSIGNTNNREAVVGNMDIILPAFPFNGCITSLKLSVNMANENVSPQGVHVMGNFQQAAGYAQDWDPASIMLSDVNKDGTYEIELTLPFGDYQYVFINGNTVTNTEHLAGSCAAAGDSGMQVRYFSFTPDSDSAPVFCFNTCESCDPNVVYEYDTYWWNDAVFYEVFLRSFYDSNADGVGDFDGLTEKLDYLNDGNPETTSDLGITGLWLMPMMTSPSYHGYDVTNYYATEPDFGTMQDFEELLAAAHARGIKVIIDLVLNHSSSLHPFFTKSATDQEGYRDWYIWSDTHPGFDGPWGQNVWHHRNGDYYYGLFWDGMPDLNYTHQPLRDEMLNVVRFWLDKGVDGFRLDAIKYLVEEGTLLENTNGTFQFLEELRDVYKSEDPDAFTVGEAWSSTPAIVPYVQNERLDMCFEFGLAGAILNAVNNSNAQNLEEQVETVLNSYPVLQYATFLTNHDIDRVFSTLGANVEKMKQAASLYLTLPGVPFVYYGEEIGMIGTGDHLNIRRPMQWSSGTYAGFSSVTPWQAVAGNYVFNNVADHAANPNSILNHYKKLIHLRNEYISLRRGQTLLIDDDEAGIFSYSRIYEEEAILVVTNTGSSFAEPHLSLEVSSMDSGTYAVKELLTEQDFGYIMINENGGFANYYIPEVPLSEKQTWILLLTPVDTPTTVDETEISSGIEIIPNPADHFIEIDFKERSSDDMKIMVFSSDGRLVLNEMTDQKRIHTSAWQDGIYFIHITRGDRHFIEKVVIRHF